MTGTSILPLCFLMVTLVASSSLPPSAVLVSHLVGEKAVLPCSWRSHLGPLPPTCHVQWRTPSEIVFEQRGGDHWQVAELQGRAEVPQELLGIGNCSLVIDDVQIGDTGHYDSFMLLGGDGGGANSVTKVFIQRVKLAVLDHKLEYIFTPGDDMVMNLFTAHSARVVFQSRNSSGWVDRWARQDKNSHRYEKHPLKEQVTLKRLRRSDEGTYKVLDEHGLSVSTVKLAVQDAFQAKLTRPADDEMLSGDAARVRCSALLTMLALLTTSQTFHIS